MTLTRPIGGASGAEAPAALRSGGGRAPDWPYLGHVTPAAPPPARPCRLAAHRADVYSVEWPVFQSWRFDVAVAFLWRNGARNLGKLHLRSNHVFSVESLKPV